MSNAVLCFHRLLSIMMNQLISLIDTTLLLNKAVIYLSFIREERRTLLFVNCQCVISYITFFTRLLFFGTLSLSTYISRNWFLNCLILSFRVVSNPSVQFRFRLSLTLYLCVYLNHGIFLFVFFSSFPSECFSSKKRTCTSNGICPKRCRKMD